MTEKDDCGEADDTERQAWMADVYRLASDSSRLRAAAETMHVHDPADGLAYRQRPLDRGAMLGAVAKLVALDHYTNPTHAVALPTSKDSDSRGALRHAGFLLSNTIRWSVMHELGLALSKPPESGVPHVDLASPASNLGIEQVGMHAYEF